MRVIISISLDSDLIVRLEQAIDERNLNRSEVFREACELWLRQEAAPEIEPQKAKKVSAKKTSKKGEK